MPVINRQVVEQMLQDITDKTKNLKTSLDKELYLMDNYPEYYTEYPFLIKKLCKVYKDKENLQLLFLLVDKMDSINSGKEDQTQVENDLGNKLADMYLHDKKD